MNNVRALEQIIENRDSQIDLLYKEAERKVREAAQAMSMKDIIETLIEINNYDDEDIGNILQDELEDRDPEAFQAWHDEQCRRYGSISRISSL